MFAKIIRWFAPAEAGASQPNGQTASSNDSALFAAINGITLEKYAELVAKMSDCTTDAEFARRAEESGISAFDFAAARRGWTARMEDTANRGKVALAFMPLYQAALKKYGGAERTATLEEYIEMSAMINSDLTGEDRVRRTDFNAMYQKFKLNTARWSQISTYWVDRLGKDPQLASHYSRRVRERVAQLDAEYIRANQVL